MGRFITYTHSVLSTTLVIKAVVDLCRSYQHRSLGTDVKAVEVQQEQESEKGVEKKKIIL